MRRETGSPKILDSWNGLFQSSVSWRWPKDTWALGTRLRGALGTRANPDTIGYVWTGEYDLNTLRVDGKFFESGTKKLRIRRYPDTCGRGLSHILLVRPLCTQLVVTVAVINFERTGTARLLLIPNKVQGAPRHCYMGITPGWESNSL